MMKARNSFAVCVIRLSVFFLGLNAAISADELQIISFDPAPPATLKEAQKGKPMSDGNTVNISFSYALESADSGKVGFYTAGVKGNPVHTGIGIPIMIKKGKGRGTAKISILLRNGDESCHVVKVRYALFAMTPEGMKVAVEKFKDVDFTFTAEP